MARKVFVNGTFDVLHLGHIDLLTYAKSLGDFLLVALDTDRRVAEKKGPTRPINNMHERTHMMLALKPVDSVTTFDSDDELTAIIADYAPDIMVVGSDWKGKPIVGGSGAKEIVYYDRVRDVSTTQKIQSIIGR